MEPEAQVTQEMAMEAQEVFHLSTAVPEGTAMGKVDLVAVEVPVFQDPDIMAAVAAVIPVAVVVPTAVVPTLVKAEAVAEVSIPAAIPPFRPPIPDKDILPSPGFVRKPLGNIVSEGVRVRDSSEKPGRRPMCFGKWPG